MKIATLSKVAIATATVLLTTAALTACSNGGSNNSSSGSSTSASANSDASGKIGLLLPETGNPRYAQADYPFFKAALSQDCPSCTLLYQNANNSASTQQQQAASLITNGAKVLVLDAVDGEASAAIVASAHQHNVPVISYDRLIDSTLDSYYISFDNVKVGQLQAQALVDHMKELGIPAGSGILQVDGSPTDNNATQFKQGADSVLSTSGYKILAEYRTPDWLASNAQNWVASQITKFGSQIKAIYDANDGTAAGAIAAEQAAKFGPVPITGQDANLAGIQNILAGTQYMTVYKAIQPEAAQAAKVAVELLRGQTPTSTATTDTPKGGGKIPSYLLQPVAVTASNIESTVVKDNFYGANTVAQICTAQYQAACTKYGIH